MTSISHVWPAVSDMQSTFLQVVPSRIRHASGVGEINLPHQKDAHRPCRAQLCTERPADHGGAVGQQGRAQEAQNAGRQSEAEAAPESDAQNASSGLMIMLLTFIHSQHTGDWL